MSSTYDFPSDNGACENTDRDIWRGPDEGNGSFYADSIHVTKDGGIGINAGGRVIVMPLRAWHALAVRPAAAAGLFVKPSSDQPSADPNKPIVRKGVR